VGAYVAASGPLRKLRARRVPRGLVLEDDVAFVDNKPYLSSLVRPRRIAPLLPSLG
jgi:hypothetical protein